MIDITHVSKTFETKGGTYAALKDINLHINKGDIYGIIGMSGAGKSTLVRCLNRLENVDSGEILLDGEDITKYGDAQLLDLRKKVSMIFQNFNLFEQKSVLDNVLFPLRIRNKPTGEDTKRACELLDKVGLGDKVHSYPSQLSGGQKQRVAIARALINNPEVILCDESTSALDTFTTNSILKLLRDISRSTGVTLVVITHEMGVVEKICNKVCVLEKGEVVENGDTKEVFSSPNTDITKRLLGQVKWDD